MSQGQERTRNTSCVEEAMVAGSDVGEGSILTSVAGHDEDAGRTSLLSPVSMQPAGTKRRRLYKRFQGRDRQAVHKVSNPKRSRML